MFLCVICGAWSLEFLHKTSSNLCEKTVLKGLLFPPVLHLCNRKLAVCSSVNVCRTQIERLQCPLQIYNWVADSCRIPLEALYTEGSIPPTVYNVVKDEEYRGEIKIGLTFTPEVIVSHSCSKGAIRVIAHNVVCHLGDYWFFWD